MITTCTPLARLTHVMPCRHKTPGETRALPGGWRLVPSLITIVIALTTASTYAQVQLPGIRVTAPREGSAGGSLELERKSSTGSRLDLKLQEQRKCRRCRPSRSRRRSR